MRPAFSASAKAGLSVALVAWLAWSVDRVALAAAMSQFGASALATAAALFVLQALILGWRWHRIVARLGGGMSATLSVRWVFVGLFFNNLLPTSIGGDAVRIWLLRAHGAPMTLAAGSVVVERGTGLVVLGLMVSACLPAVWSALDGHVWRLALALVGPGLLAGLVVASVADRLGVRSMPRRLADGLQWLGVGLRRVVGAPIAVLEVAGLGVAASMAGLLAAFVLGRELGIPLGLPAYVALVGGSVLLSALPISLGGWGVRELGMVALFGGVGVRAEQALALSLAWGLLPLLISLPGGLMWWSDRTVRRRPDQPDAIGEPLPGHDQLPPGGP